MKNLKLSLNLISVYFKIRFRNPQKVLHLIFFSFLIVIIYGFSFELAFSDKEFFLPGIIWSVIILGSTPLLSASFEEEYQNNILTRYLLSDISILSLIFSRIIANILIMFILELVMIPLIFIIFNIDFNLISGYFIIVLIFGTTAYTTLTTFFSAMTTGMNNFLISIIIYPLIFPLLMGLVKTTRFILNGEVSGEFFFWLRMIIIFNIVYISILTLISDSIDFD